MLVFIKQFSGQEIALEVELIDTVQMVKQKIQGKVGLPHNCQRMIYAGKGLEDNKTLGDYQVQPESVIQTTWGLIGSPIHILITYYNVLAYIFLQYSLSSFKSIFPNECVIELPN
jgi:large subunit ribosomal protein L40e